MKYFLIFTISLFITSNVYSSQFEDTLKLAEQGDIKSQATVGFVLSYGVGGHPSDKKEGFKWYLKAAEQGHAGSQLALCGFYSIGFGVPENKSEALKWCRKSAEQGWVHGQFSLAKMYFDGDGVPKNWPEAFKWYLKAAEQGHEEAQHNVGMFYELKANQQVSRGVLYDLNNVVQGYHPEMSKNRTAAFSWYQKAAKQGSIAAQTKLGGMYARGKVTPENYTKAFMWASMSKAQGDKQGEELQNVLKLGMTKEQIAKGQELASRCWESNFKDCD